MKQLGRKLSRTAKKARKSYSKYSARTRAVWNILAIAVIGVILFVVTRAQTPAASLEPELGAPNGVSVLSNASASNGKYVRFQTQSAPTGKFYIVGKNIVDPDGNIFLPFGANIAVRQAPWAEHGFVFNYFGTANGHSQDVLNWGWNMIRVNTACPSSGSTNSPTLAETLTGLDELITEYTAKKIVVLIDCHIPVGSDYSFNDSAVQNTLPFIRAVAQTYKNNPYVWLNTINEPTYQEAPWSPLQNSLYNEVRIRAPDMVFVADLPGFGNGIASLVDGNLGTTFGANKCNVVYGWHAYGYVGNTAGNDGAHKIYLDALANNKNLPMVIGEFGDPLKDDGTGLTASDPVPPGVAVAGNPDYNRVGANAVVKYAVPDGYGLLWWHATGDSNGGITYSLTKDKTSPWTVTAANAATKLSPSAKVFWDLSHQVRSKTKFPGNVSSSGCASAQ